MNAGFGLGTLAAFDFFRSIWPFPCVESFCSTLDRVRYRFTGEFLLWLSFCVTWLSVLTFSFASPSMTLFSHTVDSKRSIRTEHSLMWKISMHHQNPNASTMLENIWRKCKQNLLPAHSSKQVKFSSDELYPIPCFPIISWWEAKKNWKFSSRSKTNNKLKRFDVNERSKC